MEKPLKIAAWAGISVFIISIISSMFSFSLSFALPQVAKMVSGLFGIASAVAIVLFYYGFVILGRKFKVKLLVVMSWIFIVVMCVLLVVQFIGLIFAGMGSVAAQENIGFGAEALSGVLGMDSATLQVVIVIALISISFFLILGAIFHILFGKGIKQLKDNVEFSRAAGISHIIAGILLAVLILPLIVIGFNMETPILLAVAGGLAILTLLGVLFAGLIAMILDILVLFKASEKFEK